MHSYKEKESEHRQDVNKYFYIKGGSETYYFALKKLLKKNGHKIIDFSVQDIKNFESPYSDYFVSNVDYNVQNKIKEKLRIGFNIIYSVEAREKFEKLVKREQPDLKHRKKI